MRSPQLLLIGPSTRAMAYSAKRAGYCPICVDLFGDTDLQNIAAVEVIPISDYPHGLVERLAKYPSDIPLLYTGGIENHPSVYLALQQQRPVWGYLHPAPQSGNSLRNPLYFDIVADQSGLKRPRHAWMELPQDGHWLRKPISSAGGRGIVRWKPDSDLPSEHFVEEFLDGPSLAAVYVRHDEKVHCLGVTEQLISVDFLHAPSPFAYSGSISLPLWQGSAVLRCPLHADATLTSNSRGQMSTSDPCHDQTLTRNHLAELDRLGQQLIALDPALHGLFGVDMILHEGELYLLEVNPRYTASIEVLELTSGIPFIDQHAQAFGQPSRMLSRAELGLIVGKAIYFAPHSIHFPAEGPWSTPKSNDLWTVPEYADVPAPGTVIEKGQPVLTLFAEGVDQTEVIGKLQEKAQFVDRLFG
ncbi:MAG: ATP-grasp domain-containing protein [Gemmatales bacterium]